MTRKTKLYQFICILTVATTSIMMETALADQLFNDDSDYTISMSQDNTGESYDSENLNEVSSQ